MILIAGVDNYVNGELKNQIKSMKNVLEKNPLLRKLKKSCIL